MNESVQVIVWYSLALGVNIKTFYRQLFHLNKEMFQLNRNDMDHLSPDGRNRFEKI